MSKPFSNWGISTNDFGEQIIQTIWGFDPNLQIISTQIPEVVSVESSYNESST